MAAGLARSLPRRIDRPNEIHAQQPNMLASFLALPRMGVGMAQLEVALHILFVTFQAMKLSGHSGRWSPGTCRTAACSA